MKKVPLVFRDDGFSYLFGIEPPCTVQKLQQSYVDILDENVICIREIGMGAGEELTYPTQAGNRIGYGQCGSFWDLPPHVMQKIEEDPTDGARVKTIYEEFLTSADGKESGLRLGDFYVFANVAYLKSQGTDAFTVIMDGCHKKGMEVWARQELRGQPFGPLKDGKARYIIPNGWRLNWKHPEVREAYLNLFLEFAHKGADGLSIDYCVYPPFFENPEKDGCWMTAFLKDLRKRLDEELDRYVKIIARLPRNPERYGLFWKEWVQAGVVDVLIPSMILPGEIFDLPIDEYVQATQGTKCKVFGCLRPKCTNIDADPKGQDQMKGVVRYNRPLTEENDYARAALLLQSGAAGLQIALGLGKPYTAEVELYSNEYTDCWKPHYAVLGDYETYRKKDKSYPLVDMEIFSAKLTEEQPILNVPFRIADVSSEIRKAFVRPLMRNLKGNERIWFSVNGGERLFFDADTLQGNKQEPTYYAHNKVVLADEHFQKYWWEKGKKEIEIAPASLRKGENTLTVGFVAEEKHAVLEIVDIDVDIRYE